MLAPYNKSLQPTTLRVAAEFQRYMAKSAFVASATISVFSITACTNTAVPASICKIINIPIQESSSLIPAFTNYAESHNLVIGEKSSRGIWYKEKGKRFIVNLSFFHSEYSLVTLYTIETKETNKDVASLQEFLNADIAPTHKIESCSDREGFRNPVLYGYEKVAI